MYQILQKQSLHRSSVELFGVVDLHLEQMFYVFAWGKGKEPPQGLGRSSV